jgi:hypothetical protein
MVLEEVSRFEVLQTSQMRWVLREWFVSRREPQAVQKIREPIAVIFAV